MFDQIVDRWLIGLCDPIGVSELPSQRLEGDQLSKLLVLAEAHGVAGAVLANIQRLFQNEDRHRLLKPTAKFALSATPAKAVGAARERWYAGVAMTLCLRTQAKEVIAALQRARFPVALIKGEDFTDRLYSQPSLRPFRDIDLMLPRDVIDSTSEVMSERGYRFVLPEGKYNPNYGERTWDSLSAPRTRVELHWNLINCPSQRQRSSLAFEDLQWEERKTAAGQPDLRVTPAAMLLIATVHAVVSHRFDRLQHLCDIRQICRGHAGRVDCDWLRETAIRSGNASALTGALAVAGRLLEDPACESILQQLQLPVARTAWKWLVRRNSVLHPEASASKVRRTVVREWIKRVA